MAKSRAWRECAMPRDPVSPCGHGRSAMLGTCAATSSGGIFPGCLHERILYPETACGRADGASSQRWRADRQGAGGRRRTHRGAVDDEHRHRGSGQHREADRRAGARRFRTGAHHGEHAGRCRRGAAHRRAVGDDGCGGADHRRLPLQRPPAAGSRTRLRRGAGEVPHQPRQRGLRQEEGRAVRRDHREGDPVRQAGAHRRELGFAGPGDGRHPDGREPHPRRAVGRLRTWRARR